MIRAFLFFCLLASPAFAYIGPGAGLSLIGFFFGFVAFVFTAILMVLAWPARVLWKRLKARRQNPQMNAAKE